MPEDFGPLGRIAQAPSDDFGPLGRSKAGPVGPGEDPLDPIDEQHPDIPAWRRLLIMNFTNTSDQAKRYLESQNFEVVDRGDYNLSVRKKGEKQWRVLDPSKTEWQDITDVGSDVAIGTAAGLAGTAVAAPAVAAGVVAPPVGAGGIAAGIATAGGVSGALEGVKGLVGKAMGLDPSMGDVGTGMGREALWGAAGQAGGEVVGLGLRKVGKYMGLPGKVEEAATGQWARKNALEKAAAEQSAANNIGLAAKEAKIPLRQGLKDAGTELRGLTEADRLAREGLLPEEADLLARRGKLKSYEAEAVEAPWKQTERTLKEARLSAEDLGIQKRREAKALGKSKADLGDVVEDFAAPWREADIAVQPAKQAQHAALHELRQYMTEKAERAMAGVGAAEGGASVDDIIEQIGRGASPIEETLAGIGAAGEKVPAPEAIKRRLSMWKIFKEGDQDAPFTYPTAIPVVFKKAVPEVVGLLDYAYDLRQGAQAGYQSMDMRMTERRLFSKLFYNGEAWFKDATTKFQHGMARILLASKAAGEFLDDPTKTALKNVFAGKGTPADFRQMNELVLNISRRASNDPKQGALHFAWLKARDVTDKGMKSVLKTREDLMEAKNLAKGEGRKVGQASRERTGRIEDQLLAQKTTIGGLKKSLLEAKVKDPALVEMQKGIKAAQAKLLEKQGLYKNVLDESAKKTGPIKKSMGDLQDRIKQTDLDADAAKLPHEKARNAARDEKAKYGNRRYNYLGRQAVETSLDAFEGAGSFLRFLGGEPAPEAMQRILERARVQAPKTAWFFETIAEIKRKHGKQAAMAAFNVMMKDPDARRAFGG